MFLAIANGCFFNLGARLARYTNNDTYAKHAEDTWNWLWGVKYIDHESWIVYDGAHVEKNCTDINPAAFSYNAAVLTQGAAFMYNYVRMQTLTATYHSRQTWLGR
jgi:mannan endo-1,6-alpha-mannosidase